MTGALIAPDSAEFAQLFRGFDFSAYRLETLQAYGSSGEDATYAAFLNGEPCPTDANKDAWLDNLRHATQIGAWMHRVHVVREPLSDYMRFELTWGYTGNVATGEDIRILPLTDGDPWPSALPQHDYWLFDSCQLYNMHYAADEAGTFLGVEHVSDPAAVVDACRWRDAAWQQAMPWQDYVNTRPQLAAHLPAL